MEAMTLLEVLEIAAGGTAPAMLVVIWLLWKQDKRLLTLELKFNHQGDLLDEIKRKLDTVLTGFNFGTKDNGA